MRALIWSKFFQLARWEERAISNRSKLPCRRSNWFRRAVSRSQPRLPSLKPAQRRLAWGRISWIQERFVQASQRRSRKPRATLSKQCVKPALGKRERAQLIDLISG